jgi:hypothetical protein
MGVSLDVEPLGRFVSCCYRKTSRQATTRSASLPPMARPPVLQMQDSSPNLGTWILSTGVQFQRPGPLGLYVFIEHLPSQPLTDKHVTAHLPSCLSPGGQSHHRQQEKVHVRSKGQPTTERKTPAVCNAMLAPRVKSTSMSANQRVAAASAPLRSVRGAETTGSSILVHQNLQLFGSTSPIN